jgi:dienelactone hydrolase
MAISKTRLRELFGIEEPVLELVNSQVEMWEGFVIERLRFVGPDGEVRGILTRPFSAEVPLPAILYSHCHGGRYEIGADELLAGHPGVIGALGPEFARQGYVTLAIDMPTFGEREWQHERALAKALLWYGKSLFGQMLSEQAAALTYLASRADVDGSRIGAFGISMGATLSYWLAAVDDRIAATAHLCCYADFGMLISTGAHDGHGTYLTVPGLLAETSIGEIAGLVAPRPQLICVGDLDGFTPPDAVARSFAETRAAYEAAGASDQVRLMHEPSSGHVETMDMRVAVMRMFGEGLKR